MKKKGKKERIWKRERGKKKPFVTSVKRVA